MEYRYWSFAQKRLGDETTKVGQMRAFKNKWIAKDGAGFVRAVSAYVANREERIVDSKLRLRRLWMRLPYKWRKSRKAGWLQEVKPLSRSCKKENWFNPSTLSIQYWERGIQVSHFTESISTILSPKDLSSLLKSSNWKPTLLLKCCNRKYYPASINIYIN